MLRKAPLACPKTVAGLFLVAFESPIFAPRALSFFDVARKPAQNHMNCAGRPF